MNEMRCKTKQCNMRSYVMILRPCFGSLVEERGGKGNESGERGARIILSVTPSAQFQE